MSCRDACVVMDYDQYNDFSRETHPKGRKAHKCCECGRTIPIGEVHQYITGKTDGHFWDNRTCPQCEEIRKTFCCDSYVLETLWEEIGYQLFPKWDELTAVECLARLKTDAAVALMRAAYVEFRKAESECVIFNGSTLITLLSPSVPETAKE